MKRILSVSLSLILLIGLLQVTRLSITAHGSLPINAKFSVPNQVSAPLTFIVNPFSTPDWIGEANFVGDSYAASVASAGDVNGDGYADVVVGAPYYTNGQNNEGRAYAYHGSASGLATSPAWSFENDLAECELGQKVASAGDVNGDGFGDVLVASEYCTDGNPDTDREGKAYLFLGSASGLVATPSWTVKGGVFDESLGWSVASAGDVNNDGYDDVIIGAPWASYPEGHEGRVYVFYGSASGLAQTADWTAESNVWWTGFGTWVDSAGDVNADGYDDVIIGHPGLSSPEDAEGRAYVYLGSDTGLAMNAAWSFENNHPESELGCSVAGVGDVNGDGFSDVIVGAKKYANPDPYEGIAYLFLGSLSGPSLTPDWSKEGDQAYSQYSWSVEPAGDVNDDGYDDVLIGSPWYDAGETNEGMVFLYFGSPGGLLLTTVYSKGADQAEATLGWSVDTAGDVNGDGIDDIIVGARNYDGGEADEGRAIVYHGAVDAIARLLLPIVHR